MDPIPLSIRLFGAFEVCVGGEPMRSVRTRSVEWLLALLVLRHGREVSRSWLAGTLWPESSEAQALYNLRRNLSDLRQALGPEAERLRSPSQGTLLLDLTDAAVDVVTFDAAVAAVDERSLQQAVTLYRGPLLEGCVGEWLLPERARRGEACLQALEMLVDRAVERDDLQTAWGYLVQSEALDPLRDGPQRRRMQLLAASGDLPAALLSYRDYRQRLRGELNTEPDPETTRLFEQLRASARPSPSRRPPPVSHGPAPDPAAGTPEPAQSPSAPFPRPLTVLVGREAEVREVAVMIQTSRLVTLVGGGGVGKTRLALEVMAQAADAFSGGAVWVELAALAEGALVLPSIAAALGIREAAGGDAEELTGRLIARLSEGGCLLVIDNCEHLLDAAAAVVHRLLQHCPELRVLTTSRQRLDLPGEVAWRVPSLPVPGEVDGSWLMAGTRLRVGPAKTDSSSPSTINPQPSTLLACPSVQLFVERAAAARPGFRLRTEAEAEAVGLICHRLDGIPLAIELAAARARVLTPQQIAARLDDRFRLLTRGARSALPRHRTLRALIDWSYDSLPEPEAALLRRLSVFAGGWTLEAAEAVCSGVQAFRRSGVQDRQEQVDFDFAGPERLNAERPNACPDVLDLLDALVDRSLVQVEEAAEGLRYRMLETVRAYAAEKLAASGERAAVRDRHRDWCLQLAVQADEPARSPEQTALQKRMAAELDNLRAALAWCFEAVESGRRAGSSSEKDTGTGEADFDAAGPPADRGPLPSDVATAAEVGLRLADALTWVWVRAGYVTEGSEWLEGALARAAAAPLSIRAHAFLRAGNLAWTRGQKERARSFYQSAREGHEELLALARAEGDARGIATAMLRLARVMGPLGDLEAAWSYGMEAQQRMAELGDRGGLVGSLTVLRDVASERGDLEAGRSLLETSWRYFAEARQQVLERGDPAALQGLLEWLVNVALQQGESQAARPLLEARLAICRELGESDLLIHALGGMGHLERDEGNYAQARAYYQESLLLRQKVGHQIALAQALEDLAVLAGREQDWPRAIRLLGAGEAFCETIGAHPPVAVALEYERTVAESRAALGDTAFAAAWAEGQALSLDEMVEYALACLSLTTP